MNGPSRLSRLVPRACGVVLILASVLCACKTPGSTQDLSGADHSEAAARASLSDLDVIEADRLIREIFASSDTSRYADAIAAYVRVLGADERNLTPEAAALRERHLTALFMVMPPDDRPASFSQEDVDAVMLWWRRQDPLPGTRRNERLEEHLARFVYASEQYEDLSDERGYDDRGEVLVRFGPPVERLSVRIPELVRAFDFQDVVSVPDLAENEFWLYPNIGDDAYFFFMRQSRRQGFRIGLPSQIFPQRMRVGLDPRTVRGKRRAEVSLGILEEAYAQLALAHPFFGSTYDRILHYRYLPSRERPDQFIQSALAEATARESESEGRRDRTIPASATNARGISEDLPVQVRWARFLDEDGTTRTEIYWSVESTALEPSDRLVKTLERDGFEPSEAYLLTIAAARQTAGYDTKEIQRRHFRITAPSGRHLDPQTFVLEGDTGRYHVGLQWNLYWTSEELRDSVEVGALLKIGTRRLDSLSALHGQGERLEISDLKPVVPNTETPYPYEMIDPAAPADLYFELYNLHYGPDDLTDYTIEYEVSRQDRRTGRAIRVESSSAGEERNTRERIAIELGDAEMGERVHLSVRAIDNVTGESVERSLSFRLETPEVGRLGY